MHFISSGQKRQKHHCVLPPAPGRNNPSPPVSLTLQGLCKTYFGPNQLPRLCPLFDGKVAMGLCGVCCTLKEIVNLPGECYPPGKHNISHLGESRRICEAIIVLLSHFSNSAFSSRSRFNSCSKTSVLQIW